MAAMVTTGIADAGSGEEGSRTQEKGQGVGWCLELDAEMEGSERKEVGAENEPVRPERNFGSRFVPSTLKQDAGGEGIVLSESLIASPQLDWQLLYGVGGGWGGMDGSPVGGIDATRWLIIGVWWGSD